MSKATDALITANEILTELAKFYETTVYEILMQKLDISDAHFQEVRQELSRLADISIEGDLRIIWNDGRDEE